MAAELRELQGLFERGTFTQVAAPKGRNLVGTRWVYDIKRKPDRSIERFKARLVAQGFSQRKHDDYDLTIAPVMHVSSLRTLIALAARDRAHIRSWDISQAFLCTNGQLQHDVYCKLPPGFEVQGEALKLNAGLYGIRQGAQLWAVVFAKWLTSKGWVRSVQDPCIWRRGGARLGVYVDDMVATSCKPEELDKLHEELNAQYKCTGGGPCEYILGTHVRRNPDGSITMHQKSSIMA